MLQRDGTSVYDLYDLYDSAIFVIHPADRSERRLIHGRLIKSCDDFEPARLGNEGTNLTSASQHVPPRYLPEQPIYPSD